MHEPLRILMISDVYFPRVNGVSTSIKTFRKCLMAAGHRVALVAPDYGDGSGEIDVYRVPSRAVPFDPEDRFMRWEDLLKRTSELSQEGFDVIHVQTPFLAHYAGVKAARRYGIPIVETYHTFFEEYLHHYVPLLPAAATRFVARRFSASQCNAVDNLIVPSSAMLQVLRSYGVRAAADVVPTGVDLRQFAHGDGLAFRRAHKIAPDRPVMLYVGRVVFEKNVEFLLRMARRVVDRQPDALLVIAGEGPAVEPLKSMAAELGLAQNTLFVGYLDRAGELMDCYCAANAFVFASRTETQGLVLLEAMALGVPVVSTAVMGTKDIVGPARGALVAAEQEDEFATLALRVLRDAALQRAMGQAGREFARRWAEDGFAEKMAYLYQNVMLTNRSQLAARVA